MHPSSAPSILAPDAQVSPPINTPQVLTPFLLHLPMVGRRLIWLYPFLALFHGQTLITAFPAVVFHLLNGGSWKGVEDTLTSLKFIENKCRAVDPYHLQTDYSAALDSQLVVVTENDDAPGLSYLQRVRVKDFSQFVKTYAAVFRSHPELVIQQAANMPDDSPVSKAAILIVTDVTVETAWFKYINKSQLGDPCVATLKCNGPVDCICYSPDGRKIASGAGVTKA